LLRFFLSNVKLLNLSLFRRARFKHTPVEYNLVVDTAFDLSFTAQGSLVQQFIFIWVSCKSFHLIMDSAFNSHIPTEKHASQATGEAHQQG